MLGLSGARETDARYTRARASPPGPERAAPAARGYLPAARRGGRYASFPPRGSAAGIPYADATGAAGLQGRSRAIIHTQGERSLLIVLGTAIAPPRRGLRVCALQMLRRASEQIDLGRYSRAGRGRLYESERQRVPFGVLLQHAQHSLASKFREVGSGCAR